MASRSVPGVAFEETQRGNADREAETNETGWIPIYSERALLRIQGSCDGYRHGTHGRSHGMHHRPRGQDT